MTPRITKTKNGWRVDLPDGDYCCQPSEDFARAYVRQWGKERIADTADAISQPDK